MTDQSTPIPIDSLYDSLLVAGIQWPYPRAALDFMDAADHMWGTEVGRAEVRRWILMLGKQSEFVEGEMWTVAQLQAHCAKLDEWLRNNEPNALLEQTLKRSVGRPRADAPLLYSNNPSMQAAYKEWQDAIKQRRVALRQAKVQLREQIHALRVSYSMLETDWDNYVDSKRQVMLPAKSPN